MTEGARKSVGTTIAIAWRQMVVALGIESPLAAVDEYVYPSRINWADILSDLNAAGRSGYRVAALMGIEWSTVQGWMRGNEPRHSSGQALLELHTRYCGAEATKKRQSEATVSL